MKENVIIGKLIPAGTGMKRYRNIKLDSDVNEDAEMSFDDFDDFDDMSEETMTSEMSSELHSEETESETVTVEETTEE